MKKIPAGAEACNVLVGELESLNKPVVAFVRLSPAVLLSGLAEVPIVTRLLRTDPTKRYCINIFDLPGWTVRGDLIWQKKSLLPFRFLFILLGPLGRGPQYHEIGRSIATLMTDEVRSHWRTLHYSAGVIYLLVFLKSMVCLECQPEVIRRFSAGALNKFTVRQNSTISWSDGTFLSMKHSSELLWDAFGD